MKIRIHPEFEDLCENENKTNYIPDNEIWFKIKLINLYYIYGPIMISTQYL